MGVADRDYMKAGYKPRAPLRRRPRGCLFKAITAAGLGIVALLFWWKSNPQDWPDWLRKQIEKNVEPVKNERIVVDVNAASLWELRSIPGVSESVAKQIIKDRPFDSYEDLDRVFGVGPVTMGHLRKHVLITTNRPAPTKR